MKKTTIGGQALLEGIIMHGPTKSCTVVRKPDGSLDINTKNRNINFKLLRKIPFIRGFISLATSLVEGTEALSYSAEVSGLEEKPSKFELFIQKKFGKKAFDKFLLTTSLIFSVILSIGLFVILPTLLAGFVKNYTENSVLINLTEGLIRIAIFLIYMILISKLDDIQRTFMYHGAEHKSIACYESGSELNVSNAREMVKEHPRCGTSFLFVVMIISILMYSLFTWTNPILRIIIRLAMLPVVIGISYEFNRIVGKYDNFVTKMLRFPGIKLQGLTTLEPDDSMLEIALVALKEVLPENEGSDSW